MVGLEAVTEPRTEIGSEPVITGSTEPDYRRALNFSKITCVDLTRLGC